MLLFYYAYNVYFKNCSKIESFLYYSKRNGLIVGKIFNLNEF